MGNRYTVCHTAEDHTLQVSAIKTHNAHIYIEKKKWL